MYFKVLIPSAGLGSRLGESYKNLNKALVSIDNKPVISHLIEKFSKDIEIVIALGHKGNLLRDYLQIAHPQNKFKFIFVDNYFGKGSGLGYSILSCKKYLQCPFIFAPNDSIIMEDIPDPDINWIGYGNSKDIANYRSLLFQNDYVEKILEKNTIISKEQKPYIGLAGIKDYKSFWEYMESGKEYGSITTGESYAIEKFLNNGKLIKAIPFDWYDKGNLDSLNNAKQKLISNNSPVILDKNNEAIWFVSNMAIKYNLDSEFISNRIIRSRKLKGFVPPIVDEKENMYAYHLISGNTMSKVTNKVIFEKLLNFLDQFWCEEELTEEGRVIFNEKCFNFYKNKSLKRITLYFNRYSEKDNEEIINGVKVPPIKDIFGMINWDLLTNGNPTRFHGDLHFENILLSESGNFCLLDWRQDFEGLTDYGDIYYDLAKLMHGLIVSHEIINKGYYYFEKTEEIVNYGFYRKNSLVENEKTFIEFIASKGFNLFKVNLLTSLVFLNIAPLHHDPYSKLLFYLGKYNLYKHIKGNI